MAARTRHVQVMTACLECLDEAIYQTIGMQAMGMQAKTSSYIHIYRTDDKVGPFNI